MRLFLIAISALALAGCTTTRATVVPPTLLNCADQPRSPASDPSATQADVGVWVIDLAEAGADCRSKLGAVRRIFTEPTQ